jgi:hypothetical protein
MMICTPPRHEDAAHSWANGLRAELGRFLPELPGAVGKSGARLFSRKNCANSVPFVYDNGEYP